MSIEKLSLSILKGFSILALALLVLSYIATPADALPYTDYLRIQLCLSLVHHAGVMLFIGLWGCLMTDMIIKYERTKSES